MSQIRLVTLSAYVYVYMRARAHTHAWNARNSGDENPDNNFDRESRNLRTSLQPSQLYAKSKSNFISVVLPCFYIIRIIKSGASFVRDKTRQNKQARNYRPQY